MFSRELMNYIIYPQGSANVDFKGISTPYNPDTVLKEIKQVKRYVCRFNGHQDTFERSSNNKVEKLSFMRMLKNLLCIKSIAE